MSNPTCETCKWWNGTRSVGDCQRYPQPIRKQFDDWCGEHSPRTPLPVVNNEPLHTETRPNEDLAFGDRVIQWVKKVDNEYELKENQYVCRVVMYDHVWYAEYHDGESTTTLRHNTKEQAMRWCHQRLIAASLNEEQDNKLHFHVSGDNVWRADAGTHRFQIAKEPDGYYTAMMYGYDPVEWGSYEAAVWWCETMLQKCNN